MASLLKNARLIDPQVGLDEVCDLLIDEGRIAAVGAGLAAEGAEVRDLAGKIVVPGLVDIHVHLREPGQEHKEDIASGTRAAVRGGFTDVCCMPNTAPTIDNAITLDYVRNRAAQVGACRVHVAGACSKGLGGEALSDMGEMAAHGAVAFTDDGRGVQNAGMMRRVMEYSEPFGKVIMSHCQDEGLVDKGQVNEGPVSTRLGLQAWPAAGEEIQVMRDMELSRLTGAPIHIQHLTTARGLDMVRRGKAEGTKVTCEVTPHHLMLADACIDETYDTNLKVNPPLRGEDDRRALIEGVADGTVDCIVTDHAPHAHHEKDCEFELAPFGMIGLETALGAVVSTLVEPGVIGWARLVELMSVRPRQIIGIDRVALEPGCRADLTVIDPEAVWTVTADGFASKSSNSGFIGRTLKGRATDVYVAGRAVLHEGQLTGPYAQGAC
ncbi:dihydroorotase [Berryella wangjianweii]|uniref:Dihydroorotase n=1 Tax=Berryella wangjianweii TaxID=2734634 RepID=A0A6M8J2Y3_9ACTN|nr:dihydroorotase [Berryella wangjianweii]NPD32635.1 dihydroorotase [Eggerthellaceae bacterium zg-997]QKF07013.1 dihydroorotase [Berryella wangjianweii]